MTDGVMGLQGVYDLQGHLDSCNGQVMLAREIDPEHHSSRRSALTRPRIVGLTVRQLPSGLPAYP